MSYLYIVPTPIGNLGDIGERAAKTLAEVDFVAAEDTRVTLKLLSHLGVKKPLVSYHEYNKAQRGEMIVGRIASGETCALVTDAGTPAVSDPGELLVAQCIAAGISVVALPGPCAAVCALSASGLPTGRFCFEGFLPVNKKQRRGHLESLKSERRTMIFYEAPHKLVPTLNDLHAAFGDRRVTLARELTKLHEEYIRTTLARAVSLYAEKSPRGEFVLIVEGASEQPPEPPHAQELDLSRTAKDVLNEAKQLGVSRNEAYKAKLKAKEEE